MKSHVNIMDSDIAYENVIVYHGSDHILKEPIYQGGKQIMIMEMDFIPLNIKTVQKAGLF